MDNEKFINLCKKLVKEYTLEHLDRSDSVPDFYVFVVWLGKALQNNKALLSTSLRDGMYYEITFNGNENEIYLDAYKKFENRRIEVEEH